MRRRDSKLEACAFSDSRSSVSSTHTPTQPFLPHPPGNSWSLASGHSFLLSTMWGRKMFPSFPKPHRPISPPRWARAFGRTGPRGAFSPKPSDLQRRGTKVHAFEPLSPRRFLLSTRKGRWSTRRGRGQQNEAEGQSFPSPFHQAAAVVRQNNPRQRP